ncbi:putative protein kinase RLK-Pelle-LRR-IX family [Helianthus annuus]|nr:putative protein kinase RLK-Pelle-LRR-IX family [Helianthus annuus]
MKKTHLPFLLLTFTLSLTTVHSQSNDSDVMQTLKHNLDPSTTPNWSDPNPCNWVYVTCSKDNRVTGIQANGLNLKGSLPQTLNNLTQLQLLELQFNQLSGPLPSLTGLTQLQNLFINNNNFTSIPNDFFDGMSSLQNVYLDYNAFDSWSIPHSLKIASNSLSLSNNSLTGTVPHSLTGLQSLKVLNLSNNMFQGPMPKFDASVSVDMTGIGSFCLQEPGVECDSRVNLLVAVAESVGYPQLFAEKWKGNDPCNLWLGITCSSSGEITVVNFRKMGLTGTISTNFSSIMSLQRLILADNNLTGVIPNELKDLPHLVEIDVSNNQLYGKVPSFKENVTVVSDGNPKMETDGPTATPVSPSGGDQRPKGNGGGGGNGGGDRGGDSGGGGGRGRGRSNTGIFVGCFIGGVGTVLLMALLAYCVYKLKSKLKVNRSRSPVNHSTVVVHPRHSGSDGDGVKITIDDACTDNRSQEINSMSSSGPSDNAIEVGNLLISIQVLKSVTNNFSPSNILGRGGFGTVYKGELHDGTKIAVKRMELSITNEKGLFEFQSEISVLTKVRHRHLVALLGYCLDGNERLLVLEYMPQGALSRFLFNWESEDLKPLDWTTRLVIALDVAKGVEYLHGLAQQSFIHRDLKPSNILLGDDMRAKVGDFGLVRLAPDGKVSLVTQLAGTFGYLAPEYAVAGRVTTKIDVFSFGVILMELITGRKALEETQPEDSVHLVQWFKKMHINKATFRKAIDPCLEPFLDETALASVTMVAELAGHCCAREPYQRPDMSHAVNVLSSLTDLWKPTESDQDDIYGIDLDTPLPQVVKRWQAMDNESGRTDNTRSSLTSLAYAHHDPMASTINSDGENRF